MFLWKATLIAMPSHIYKVVTSTPHRCRLSCFIFHLEIRTLAHFYLLIILFTENPYLTKCFSWFSPVGCVKCYIKTRVPI